MSGIPKSKIHSFTYDGDDSMIDLRSDVVPP